MDEKLSVMVPETLKHEEFPLHIYTAGMQALSSDHDPHSSN
jgi:hypothetical protein